MLLNQQKEQHLELMESKRDNLKQEAKLKEAQAFGQSIKQLLGVKGDDEALHQFNMLV